MKYDVRHEAQDRPRFPVSAYSAARLYGMGGGKDRTGGESIHARQNIHHRDIHVFLHHIYIYTYTRLHTFALNTWLGLVPSPAPLASNSARTGSRIPLFPSLPIPAYVCKHACIRVCLHIYVSCKCACMYACVFLTTVAESFVNTQVWQSQ